MKQKPSVKSIDQLVINWHITEVCNYSCEYCYAKWKQEEQPRELLHDLSSISRLLRQLYDYFKPDNMSNPLVHYLSWKSVRLNIAGGEPTLYKDKLIDIITEARAIGFDVSIITNGSQFEDLDFVKSLASNVSMLGISLDSIEPNTNQLIGRIDKNKRQISLESLGSAIQISREINLNISIKINTVVNHINYLCDMNMTIQALRPEKWKVLRALPVVSDTLTVSNNEFLEYVSRHKTLSNCMVVENNLDMVESYIMINPMGLFFQNTTTKEGDSYLYSPPILEVGVLQAFKNIGFSAEKFAMRYCKKDD